MSDTPIDESPERTTSATPDEPIALGASDEPSGVIRSANDVAMDHSTAPSTAPIENVPTMRDPMSSGSLSDGTALSSQSRKSRTLWSTRLSLLLVAALVGGLAGHFASPASSNSGGGVTIDEVSTAPGAALLPNGTSIPKLVQKVLPSIVSVDVKGNGSEDEGTGMIISKGGLVITNNHVISAAVNGGTISITRSGTTKSEAATLVGTNPIDDVALHSYRRRVGSALRHLRQLK